MKFYFETLNIYWYQFLVVGSLRPEAIFLAVEQRVEFWSFSIFFILFSETFRLFLSRLFFTFYLLLNISSFFTQFPNFCSWFSCFSMASSSCCSMFSLNSYPEICPIIRSYDCFCISGFIDLLALSKNVLNFTLYTFNPNIFAILK